MNVKVFIYFSDVAVEHSLFCFVPGTHPLGARRWLTPEGDEGRRSTDEQMACAVPAEEWRICTGPAGTVIFCDTCGYHKGLKPQAGNRLMVMFQYTSGRTPTKQMCMINWAGSLDAYRDPIQRWALDLSPWHNG